MLAVVLLVLGRLLVQRHRREQGSDLKVGILLLLPFFYISW
jgi:hypothetical protein